MDHNRNFKGRIIIALEDLDFSWTKEEVKIAIKEYNAGASFPAMAQKLRPKININDAIDEVALLIMDLTRKNKIKPRGYL